MVFWWLIYLDLNWWFSFLETRVRWAFWCIVHKIESKQYHFQRTLELGSSQWLILKFSLHTIHSRFLCFTYVMLVLLLFPLKLISGFLQQIHVLCTRNLLSLWQNWGKWKLMTIYYCLNVNLVLDIFQSQGGKLLVFNIYCEAGFLVFYYICCY